MALTKEKKELIVEDLSKRFSTASTFVFADFKGMDVQEMNVLRRQMQGEGVRFTVVKNTLLRRIMDNVGLDSDEPCLKQLEGQTGIAYATDEVLPAKIIERFAKNHGGRPSVKAGYVAGRSLDAESVKKLAELPGRDELLSKMLGSLQAPMRDFAAVGAGLIRKFIYAVDALRRNRED